jgi:hypothetical protein
LNSNTVFVSGYSIPQTKLLETITVKYGNDDVRQYQFKYSKFPFFLFGRTAHLQKIFLKEYDETGANEQLRPTEIFWETQNNDIAETSATVSSEGDVIFGDFNGDGYTDYVVYNIGNNSQKQWKLYLQNYLTGTFYLQQTGTCQAAQAYCGDFYGKGKDDLILAENRYTQDYTYWINVYTYENNQFNKSFLKEVSRFYQAFLGDFSGDGKVNIMYVSKQNTQYTLHFSNNGNFTSSSITINNINDIRIVDYNGNGKANIQVTTGSYTYIYEYLPAQNAFSNVFYTGFPTEWHSFFHGDFNGDGITDIIEFTNNKWILKLAHGDGWYEYPGEHITILNSTLYQHGGYKYPVFIADIDGDGKDDIIQPVYDKTLNTTTLTIYYSEGFANGSNQFSCAQKTIEGHYCYVK